MDRNVRGLMALYGLVVCAAPATAASVYDGFDGGLYQETAVANGYTAPGVGVPNPVYGTDYWGGNGSLNQPGSGAQGDPAPWANSNRRTGTGWSDLTMGTNSSSGPNNNQYRRQTGWNVQYPGTSYLTNAGLSYGTLPTSGGAYIQTSGGTDAGRNVGTTYADQAGESGWGSFIYNRTSGTGADWGGFGLYDVPYQDPSVVDFAGNNEYTTYSGFGSSQERLLLGMPYSVPGNFGVTKPGGDLFSGVPLNQTNFVVFQVEDTGAGDTLRVWLNPSLTADLSTLTPDITASYSELAFDAVRLRTGGGGTWTWDEIRIGSTAADVGISVPEPASLGLISLSGVAALRRRRA
jgi:hypothetical protein